jgi:hypothetical protein
VGYFSSRPFLTVVLNEDEPDPTLRNTVTLRKWTTAERQYVADLTVAPLNAIEAQFAVRQGRRPEIFVNMPRQRLEMVKVCVESWGGPAFEGRPATPENIDLLPPEILDLLADACDGLNQGLSDDEKKAFAAPTSTPS